MDLQLSTVCLPHTPLRSSFAAARALGLERMEVALTPLVLHRGPARVARLAARYGVAVTSFDLGPLGPEGLDRLTIRLVADFIAPFSTCRVITLPAPHGDGKGVAGMSLNRFLRLAEYCREVCDDHVAIAVANAPAGDVAALGPLAGFPSLRRVVEEWDLRYTYDTSHAASAGWVITEPLPQMARRLVNVHLSDFQHPGATNEPISSLLPTGVLPAQLYRPLGEGYLPLRAFLRALQRREYAGLLTLIPRERGFRSWWLPAMRAQLAASILFCRSVLQDRAALDAFPSQPLTVDQEQGRR